MATLLLTYLNFLVVGRADGAYYVTAPSVCSIACIAASNESTASQDTARARSAGSAGHGAPLPWAARPCYTLRPMSWLEIAGDVTGLACVWLTARQSVWCWPTGILNAALFFALFFGVRLYADAGLQLVFVALSVYGWWHWLHPGPARAALPVTRIGAREAAVLGAIVVAVAAAMGAALHTWTDAALPFWDSTIVALSLAAQYLLARKVLESWALWIAVDVLSVGLYVTKDLHLTASLYAVFLVLACQGLLSWRRSLGGAVAAEAS